MDMNVFREKPLFAVWSFKYKIDIMLDLLFKKQVFISMFIITLVN